MSLEDDDEDDMGLQKLTPIRGRKREHSYYMNRLDDITFTEANPDKGTKTLVESASITT